MEMEAPRRSAVGRSREPGLKKLRLTEEEALDWGPSAGVAADRDRPYPQPRPVPVAANAGGGNPKFRATVWEREDSEQMGRGETSYQQLQEAVAQYKTALAELKFNSKPIITNLTIIAGENHYAAKAIAATVCANVLEVPNEQKLSSLYLLDSIVKNIGRDYIKYFAARLPEVFNNAYKQVDVSTHSSMRHLFGTWKGFFPSSCLQLIEKELGFPPVINGSSGGTTTRADTQAQRPLHSIHVNPKYLEARQRLQQSTRGKEIRGEEIKEDVPPIDDVERPVSTPSTGSIKQWPELSNKVPTVDPQKEQLNNYIHERKGYKEARGTGFSTQLSRKPDLGIGRTIDRIEDPDELDKPYFGAGGTAESTAYLRNGFDANHAYGSYKASESTPINSNLASIHLNSLQGTNWPAVKNWKNSEEDYIWDDPGSRSADYKGVYNSIRSSWNTNEQDKPTSLQSLKRMSTETERLDSRWNNYDAFLPLTKDAELEEKVTLPRDHDEHYSQHQTFQDSGTRINKGVWPRPDNQFPTVGMNLIRSRVSCQTESRLTPLSGVLLSNESSALSWPGFQASTLPSSMGPSMDVLGSAGAFVEQRQMPLQSPSQSVPSVPSVPFQCQKHCSLIDKGNLPTNSSQNGQKSSQLSGSFNLDSFMPVTSYSFPILPRDQQVSTLKVQPSLPQASQPPSSPFTELKKHMPSLQQSHRDLSTHASQNEISTPLSQGYRANHSKGFSSAMHSNNPIDDSEQSSTSNLLAAIMKTGLLPNKPANGLQNLNVQPPLPSGPSPVQTLTSYASLTNSSSSSHGIVPALAPPLLGGVLPPLPPGPPPSSSLLGTSSHDTNSASIDLNPLSSLLSSLVAKGIITSVPTQLPPLTSNQMSKESPTQNSDLEGSTSTPPSSLKELSVSEPSTPGIVSLVPSTKTEFDNLIGFHFKTEIVREFHPLVIDSILDDLKHQCNECGLRFRHQEQLRSHLDWHKNSELSSSYKLCRRWYSTIGSWLSGDFEPSCGPITSISLEAAPSEEHMEPMVAADESQSICALCGEPFEDFYSVERDEWMYKGAIYLNLMDEKGNTVDWHKVCNPNELQALAMEANILVQGFLASFDTVCIAPRLSMKLLSFFLLDTVLSFIVHYLFAIFR